MAKAPGAAPARSHRDRDRSRHVTGAPARLLRSADEWEALGQELTNKHEPGRILFVAIAITMREVALALIEERAGLEVDEAA